MPIDISPTLVLETAPSGYDPSNAPTASAFPGLVVNSIPNDLGALIDHIHNNTFSATGSSENELRTAASGIINTALGSSYGLSSAAATESMDDGGKWKDNPGYCFQIQKNNADYSEPLTGVTSDCICKFLLSIEPS
ncbi:MAG: hypothetical protein AAF517_27320 [Planctomycetota bacterium]